MRAMHTTFLAALLVYRCGVYGGEIHDAAAKGDIEKVEKLLRSKPELVNARDEMIGWTPLYFAVGRRQKEMVEFLLANQAHVNAEDSLGATPLYYATIDSQKEIADVRQKHGGKGAAAPEFVEIMTAA